MPPETAKRESPPATPNGDDHWDNADERPRKKSRPSKKPVGEDDEDPARNASKQLQTWTEWQSTFNAKEKDDKRDFANALKAQAGAQREDIGSYLGKTFDGWDIAGEKHANALRKACEMNISATKDASPSPNNAREIRQNSQLFKTSQQFLQVCRELFKTYEEANREAIAGSREITNHLRGVRTKWGSDTTQIDEVLKFGLDYGAKIVECSVSPLTTDEDKSTISAPDRSSFREAGQAVLDIYQKSAKKLSDAPTWGEGIKTCTEKMLALVAASETMD